MRPLAGLLEEYFAAGRKKKKKERKRGRKRRANQKRPSFTDESFNFYYFIFVFFYINPIGRYIDRIDHALTNQITSRQTQLFFLGGLSGGPRRKVARGRILREPFVIK